MFTAPLIFYEKINRIFHCFCAVFMFFIIYYKDLFVAKNFFV